MRLRAKHAGRSGRTRGLHGRRLGGELLEARCLLAANVLRVDVDSVAPVPDGTSWQTAYVSLQDALDYAAVLNADGTSLNNISQIWIAEGTYIPTARIDANGDGFIDPDPRCATFTLLNNVSLYGGFSGTESTLNQRDPAIDGVFPHKTTFSGDLRGNDAFNIPTANLSDAPTRQDNAYTVVIGVGYGQPMTLDGLTITGGNAEQLDRLWCLPQGWRWDPHRWRCRVEHQQLDDLPKFGHGRRRRDL